MEGHEVAEVLVAGLGAYSVPASADVRTTGEETWLVSLDFEPTGMDLEVARRAPYVRVMWSGGTVDMATLGQALDYALRDAGVLDKKGRAITR